MTYFLDLFAGIGGFAKGAHDAGLRFARHFYSEIDPYAIKVYSARFPSAEPLGDIKTIRGENLPKGDWIIAGGFPCQDISVAGKGAGLAGERSGLWYEYARIIGELRPRICIMENVGALAFRGLDSVLGSLAALGYDAEWQDIRASDVGAMHRRERIWIVAYPKCDSVQGWQIEGEGDQRDRLPRKQLSGLLQFNPRDEVSAARVWREANGISKRLDVARNKSIGNSIVPQIAEMIFSQSIFDEWRVNA